MSQGQPEENSQHQAGGDGTVGVGDAGSPVSAAGLVYPGVCGLFVDPEGDASAVAQ